MAARRRSQFKNGQAGIAARDAAIEQVVENAGPSFTAQVLEVVAKIRIGTVCNAEASSRTITTHGEV
jgi:hypothetical protein